MQGCLDRFGDGMSAWKEYQAEAEALAKRLGKIIRKRESRMMTRDDPALADTLAQEMRAVMDEIIQSQEKHLTAIQQDPMQLLDVLKEMFGNKGPKPSEMERDKIDPDGLRKHRMETPVMRPHDLVRKTDIS